MPSNIDYRFAFLLVIFPIYHAVKYILLIRKANFYIDEYIKLWENKPCIDFLEHKTRINSLLNSANYVPKIYLVTDPVQFGINGLTRQAVITDVFLRREYAQEFLEAMTVSCGELQRLFFLMFSPVYWIKKIIFIPVSMFSLFGLHFKKTLAFIVSASGWLVAYLFVMYQAEIKAFLDNLLGKLTP